MMEILNEIFGYFFLFVFCLWIALAAIGLVGFLFIILILPFLLGLFLYLLFTGQYFWAFLAFLGLILCINIGDKYGETDSSYKYGEGRIRHGNPQ